MVSSAILENSERSVRPASLAKVVQIHETSLRNHIYGCRELSVSQKEVLASDLEMGEAWLGESSEGVAAANGAENSRSRMDREDGQS